MYERLSGAGLLEKLEFHLISTYQVSSAKLDSQSAQRTESLMPWPGIEAGFPDCRSGVLTTTLL